MITDRKAAILEAFMNLVRRYGVDKTTMQDVAREVGISVGMIYKDFAGKDDLVNAYIDKLIHQILFECGNLAQQAKSAKELLHDVIIGFCKLMGKYLSEDRGFIQCIFGDLYLGQIKQKAVQFEDAFSIQLVKIIEKILVKGQAEGSFRVADIPNAAFCFINSFGFFIFDLLFSNRKLEESMVRAEQMFSFVIKAVEDE